MSYLALARKWRPKIFSEVVGQTHVVKALANALDQQRLHHAYLFTGTRGVGKTTLARIFAKCLNCEQGTSANPCGLCGACQEIDDGRYIDLIEVDAASRTKVEDTRELLDNVQYSPTRGQFKVYLIDEVHMLSGHSFNALLKTLEEPPPHVKFLLATTDPQKLPMTVLSRCLQFNLKKLPDDAVVQQLENLMQAENVPFEKLALRSIARVADGSMRDALSLLDQAIAYCEENVTERAVHAMLGTVPREYLHKLMYALADEDAATIMQCTHELAQLAADFNGLFEDIIDILHQTAIVQAVPHSSEDSIGFDEALVGRLSKQLSPEDVQLFYQVALIGKRDLHLYTSQQSALEITLLRMLSFKPVNQATGKCEPSADRVKTTELEDKEKAEPTANRSIESLVDSGTWSNVAEKLSLKGAAQELAARCSVHKAAGNQIVLKLAKPHESIAAEGTVRKLEQALQAYFEREEIKLRIELSSDDIETPAKEKDRVVEQRMLLAKKHVEEDEAIRSLKLNFGAQIVPGSVKFIGE